MAAHSRLAARITSAPQQACRLLPEPRWRLRAASATRLSATTFWGTGNSSRPARPRSPSTAPTPTPGARTSWAAHCECRTCRVLVLVALSSTSTLRSISALQGTPLSVRRFLEPACCGSRALAIFCCLRIRSRAVSTLWEATSLSTPSQRSAQVRWRQRRAHRSRLTTLPWRSARF